jgi:hypothetical protein
VSPAARGTGVLTPPRQAPGTELSTGRAAGRGGQGGQSGQGSDAAPGTQAQTGVSPGPGGITGAKPTPEQERLLRKSEQIDRTVMRSICTGC